MATSWRRSAGAASLWEVRATRRTRLPFSSPRRGKLTRGLPSGISWSVRETAAAAGTDGEPAFPSRIPAEAPNVAKANSGYSLSSLFKGRSGRGHEVRRSHEQV